MIRALGAVLNAWRRLRFRLWVIELRLRLHRAGARLELDAPHGATLDSRPVVRAFPLGTGSGVFSLRVGPEVKLGHRVTIEIWAGGDNRLAIGRRSLIEDSVRLILRSGTIEMGEFCNLRDGAWLKSDGELILGDNVQVSQHDALHCDRRLELEDWVGLAERVTVLDSDHSFDGSDVHFRDQPLQVAPTTLGRNTFVAANAVVLRGSTIGANSFVAANAVVRGGDYPAGSLLAGIPARVTTTRAEADDPG